MSTANLIFTAISTLLLTENYLSRFRGFIKNTYSAHPLTVGVWVTSSIVSVVFVANSQNSLLLTLLSYSLCLQTITLIWSIRKFRNGEIKKWKIEIEDYVSFALAIFALVFYILSENPVLGMTILFFGEILGDVPQMRKNYLDPKSECVHIVLISAIRAFISFGTLQVIDVVGFLKTAAWGIFVVFELVWLLYCRKRLEKIEKNSRKSKKSQQNFSKQTAKEFIEIKD